MTDYPAGPIAGVLAYLFLDKLCDRLERDNQLAPGERGRIWAEIFVEMQDDGRSLAAPIRQAMIELGLTKK